MSLIPKNKEAITIYLCGKCIEHIRGIKDIIYPEDLNAFIVVMKSGKRYLVVVNDYIEED